jgi:hypothetical protein
MQLPPYHDWVNRRQLFTAAGLAAVAPVPTPLPSHAGMSDVLAAQAVTTRLRAVGRASGGAAVVDALAAHAHRVERLLDARMRDVVRPQLVAAAASAHASVGGRSTTLVRATAPGPLCTMPCRWRKAPPCCPKCFI